MDSKVSGGHSCGVTPVPIPNTEVKPDTADGTAWETAWESRSLPAVMVEPDVVETHDVGLVVFLAGRLGLHQAPQKRTPTPMPALLTLTPLPLAKMRP